MRSRECDICLTERAEFPICNIHATCRTCFDNTVAHDLKCPFEGTEMSPSMIPMPVLKHYITSSRADRVVLRDPYQHIVDDVLTLKCPRCDQAFVDFDACLVLLCSRCSHVFCGLCMCELDARTSHEHVRTCPSRPPQMNDNYHMRLEDWQQVMDDRKCDRISDVIDVARGMNAMYAWLLTWRVLRVFPAYARRAAPFVRCAHVAAACASSLLATYPRRLCDLVVLATMRVRQWLLY